MLGCRPDSPQGSWTIRRTATLRVDLDLLERGKSLPVDLTGRAICYTGPVDAVAVDAVRPTGPTTAPRMDKFVEPLLTSTGLLVMIGKAEREPVAIDSIKRHGAAYLAAVICASIEFNPRQARSGIGSLRGNIFGKAAVLPIVSLPLRLVSGWNQLGIAYLLHREVLYRK